MSAIDDFTIGIDARILDAIGQIEHNHTRTVVVVDGPTAVGVLSEGDIMRALLKGVDVHAPISEIVRYDFRHLPTEDWAGALDLMRRHGIGLVAIVAASGELTGVMTMQDVLARVRLDEA